MIEREGPQCLGVAFLDVQRTFESRELGDLARVAIVGADVPGQLALACAERKYVASIACAACLKFYSHTGGEQLSVQVNLYEWGKFSSGRRGSEVVITVER